MAGYSDTPLIKKLGIKPAHKILVKGFPEDYSELVGTNLDEQFAGKNETPDLVHIFIKSTAELDRYMFSIKKVMKSHTTIWVSWYKRSSGIKTDVTEDVIRSYALSNGLVDVKVCAVDEVWSGLKLVVPLKLR